MKARYLLPIIYAGVTTGCGSGGSSSSETTETTTSAVQTTAAVTVTPTTASTPTSTTAASLSTAYLDFSHNVDIALDGNEVVIESNGQPDHTSPYWNPDNSSGLYVEPDPAITTASRMSPGFIEDYSNLFSLRVAVNPTLAASSSATSLGAVGIAVSGAPIFNDQEGPADEIGPGVIQGFDENGAHTGPSTYHYHLEPKAITNDDFELVGVIADGFFIYGRKCWETMDYPTDLDISGGHVGFTQHTGATEGDEVYHYHIKNEVYLTSYYLLFPEDYQGTPSRIAN